MSSGIRNCDVRVAEIVVRELEKAKPDKWGYVQTRELWLPQEERQVCTGHLCLMKSSWLTCDFIEWMKMPQV
jgi:hypothetical protein